MKLIEVQTLQYDSKNGVYRATRKWFDNGYEVQVREFYRNSIKSYQIMTSDHCGIEKEWYGNLSAEEANERLRLIQLYSNSKTLYP